MTNKNINIELIETLRKQCGYTQEEISNLMGYGFGSTYNRQINSKREFTVNDIVNLCKLFSIELNELIIL